MTQLPLMWIIFFWVVSSSPRDTNARGIGSAFAIPTLPVVVNATGEVMNWMLPVKILPVLATFWSESLECTFVNTPPSPKNRCSAVTFPDATRFVADTALVTMTFPVTWRFV